MTHARTPVRLGFAGTPEFARRVLAALLAAGHSPELVLTQPPRPAGRGKRVQPSSVGEWAEQAGLRVLAPVSLRNEEARSTIREAALDVLVVVAYGLILPSAVLSLPRLGCLNVHASLLPRWRGAAPIERAVMAGDAETGACLMLMDEGLDTGPVFQCERIPIGRRTTAKQLASELAATGSRLLIEWLRDPERRVAQPQSGEPTYAHKITAHDTRIDWYVPAPVIDRQVRALDGRQSAWALLDGARVRVLEAQAEDAPPSGAPGVVLGADRHAIRVQCGTGALAITRLAVDRGKGAPLTAADAVNGYPALFAVGGAFDVGG